jgi:hypothetical protein
VSRSWMEARSSAVEGKGLGCLVTVVTFVSVSPAGVLKVYWPDICGAIPECSLR